jgi:hypothetical protein
MAFVMAHPGVTSAIIGPRTMQQLDDLLAGAGVVLATTSWTGSTSRAARNRCRAHGRDLRAAGGHPGCLRRRPVARSHTATQKDAGSVARRGLRGLARVAHAQPMGWETYITGWHSLLIRQI